MDSVRVEALVAAEPGAAFEWFIDPVLLVRWWPSEAETHPEPGGPYRLYWDGPDVTLRGEYAVVEPGERLSFSWSWDHDELPPRTVDVSFVAAPGGTTVTVDHEAESEAEGNDYVDGWTYFLGRLASQIDAG